MKSNPHKISFPSADNELYWATITYYRHWISSDGPWTLEVQRTAMTPKMLTRIAIRYNIMRGVSSKDERGQKTDVHQTNLCALVNKAAKNWPRQFLKRAKKCEHIALAAQKKGCFKNFQGSAVSKLMWFIRPNDWTMFDNLAARGLGVRPNSSSRARMNEFYKTLDNKKLPTLWRSMQRAIDLGCLKGMPAPRVIDNLLMNRAREDVDGSRIYIAKFWISVLTPFQAREIHTAAAELEAKFGAKVQSCLPSFER